MQDDRLNNLMTYTTFHIGVYVTLITAFIAAGIFTGLNDTMLRFSTGCFLLSGLCGGVIGSNIPDYPDFASFSKAKLGFWGMRLFNYKVWTTVEHLAFWIGILPFAIGFIVDAPELRNILRKAG